MEQITQLFSDADMGKYLVLLLSAGAAATMGAVLVNLTYEFFSPARQRVKKLNGSYRKKKNASKKYDFKKAAISISQVFTPTKGKEVSKIRKQLEYIGYDNPSAIKLFFGAKFLLAGIAIVGVYFSSKFFPEYSTSKVLIAAGGAAFVAMLIPNKILEIRHEKQRDILRRGFPDSLDLLLVCVEAGLGLNAAIQRVAKELAISHQQLSNQYMMVNEEIRVGVDRIKALKNFAERTGLEDAENLVNLLGQSMKYGTSVGDTLRVFAAELREKRVQAAEEQASMVGTKLIFPLVLCIFPSFFLIMVGPAVIGVIRALAD